MVKVIAVAVKDGKVIDAEEVRGKIVKTAGQNELYLPNVYLILDTSIDVSNVKSDFDLILIYKEYNRTVKFIHHVDYISPFDIPEYLEVPLGHKVFRVKYSTRNQKEVMA